MCTRNVSRNSLAHKKTQDHNERIPEAAQAKINGRLCNKTSSAVDWTLSENAHGTPPTENDVLLDRLQATGWMPLVYIRKRSEQISM